MTRDDYALSMQTSVCGRAAVRKYQGGRWEGICICFQHHLRICRASALLMNTVGLACEKSASNDGEHQQKVLKQICFIIPNYQLYSNVTLVRYNIFNDTKYWA